MIVEMLRGYSDAIILKLLDQSDSYGYLLNQEIAKQTRDQLKFTEATLYTTFKRLEQNQYIRSYYREGINNVMRKYYTITDLGRAFLSEQIKNYEIVQDILSIFLKEKDIK